MKALLVLALFLIVLMASGKKLFLQEGLAQLKEAKDDLQERQPNGQVVKTSIELFTKKKNSNA